LKWEEEDEIASVPRVGGWDIEIEDRRDIGRYSAEKLSSERRIRARRGNWNDQMGVLVVASGISSRQSGRDAG
jgi:hypothetical protein